MRGSRIFWIIMAVAVAGAIALATALKLQTDARRERLHHLGTVPATR